VDSKKDQYQATPDTGRHAAIQSEATIPQAPAT